MKTTLILISLLIAPLAAFAQAKPDLPSGDAAHPIDRFVLAKLQEKHLQPSATADARTILRRLNFDLIGLLRGEDLSLIHQRAVDVAAFVCTKAGATPELLPEFRR